MSIDKWFAQIRQKYSKHMQCGKGCTACCHGLFDISVGDALQVARALKKLPDDSRAIAVQKARKLHDDILRITGTAQSPVLLSEDEPRIDMIVDAAGSPPCPLLGDSGECLIYNDRPLPCRLEGAPMVDIRSGLFGDWCELNFTEGVPAGALQDLQRDYDAMDAAEESRSAEVAARAQIDDARAVTFIPSVIAEFDYWASLF